MKQYERTTQQLLRRLGVNSSYLGFWYTTYGVIQVIQNSELLIYICKGLYAEVAINFHTSISNVERNIRTVINIIWMYGDRELLNEIFKRELIDKPRNADFIDNLSQYIVDYCEENEIA